VTDLRLHQFGPDGAPTLLLLHGLTEAGTAWPDAVRRWRGRWRVVAVDLRGHGASPRFTADQHPRSYQVWLDDVLGVLRELPDRPILVGHSLGGLFALRAAAAVPDLVRGVVLEDPARPTGDVEPDPDLVAAQERFLDAFADGTAAEKARMRTDSGWTADEIEAWADCKPLVDRGMIRSGMTLGEADWPDLFDRLVLPTLVVVPESSDMAPKDGEVANPFVSVARIPGVGHCVRRDDPDAYHALVDPFLAETFRAAAG